MSKGYFCQEHMTEDCSCKKDELLACPVERGVMCDGDCEKHAGEVKRVNVVNEETDHDWGEFNYCEAAIDEDRKRGLKVTNT